MSDRNVSILPILFHWEEADMVSTLRWSIEVHDLCIFRHHACQFFANSADISHGHIEVVCKQCSNGGGISSTRYIVSYNEVENSLKVLSNCRRHDMQASSEQENRIEVFDMAVEAERAVTTDAIIRCKSQFLGCREYIAHQSEVMQYHTLWLSCRARRIYDVSVAVRSAEIYWFTRHAPVQFVNKKYFILFEKRLQAFESTHLELFVHDITSGDDNRSLTV